jgi:septation ring formation regulator EzrA
MARNTTAKRVWDLSTMELAELIDVNSRTDKFRYMFVSAHLDLIEARLSSLEAKIDAMRAELRAAPRLPSEGLDQPDKRTH